MQTILKVICDNRGQADMVDQYLARFAVKASRESESIEFPSMEADDVFFARDDVRESRDDCAQKAKVQLGSFAQSPKQANGRTKFVFMNPIILSYRPNGQSLRFWVASPSSGTAPNADSD
jgi:hypothetical protein